MGYQLGVDLGTTFTAAAINDSGRLEAVRLGRERYDVPSVVYLRDDDQLVVGEDAVERGRTDPTRLSREFKRRLGDPVQISLGHKSFPPELLMARVLRWVVHTTTERQGLAPDKLVVTHPASWGGHRREQLRTVVRLADVGPASTCTEPDAAAMQFAATHSVAVGEVIAVYDLGGGTFDAATLRREETGFALLGHAQGIDELGGADFNQAVFDIVMTTLRPQLVEVDMEDHDVIVGLYELRRQCALAKELLSADTEAVVPVALPGIPRTAIRVTRSELEATLREPLAASVDCLKRAVASTKLSIDELKAIVLVGGSARIPLVTELLSNGTGMTPIGTGEPKLAVCLGAARLAGQSARNASPVGGRSVAGRSVAAPPVVLRHPNAEAAGARRPGTSRVRPVTQGSSAHATGSSQRSRVTAVLVVSLLVAVVIAFWPRKLPSDDESLLVVKASDLTSVDLGSIGVAVTEIKVDAIGMVPYVGTIQDDENHVGTFSLGIAASLFVAGPVTAHVTKPGKPTLPDVVIDPERRLTISAGLAVALVLFIGAYVEYILRPVRRRHRARPSDLIAMTLLGALFGYVMLAAPWMLLHRLWPGTLPSVVTMLASGVAGAALALLTAAPKRH